jgi:hypothetical protein
LPDVRLVMLRALLLALLLQLAGPAWSQDGKDLIELLQKGGYTIFFRHSITDGADPNKVNPPNENLRDCTTQRPLNELGREQAKLIGEKFRAHQIPVGDVYASVVCRCEETAQLAFGKVIAVDWMVLRPGSDRLTELERQLQSVPSTGFFSRVPSEKNNVYVGHAQTLTRRLVGPMLPRLSLAEGEGVVYDPKNGRYVGRINPSRW